MSAPPVARISFEVFCQSTGLSRVRQAMFRAYLQETQQPRPRTHATLDEWQQWYYEALTTVVTT